MENTSLRYESTAKTYNQSTKVDIQYLMALIIEPMYKVCIIKTTVQSHAHGCVLASTLTSCQCQSCV